MIKAIIIYTIANLALIPYYISLFFMQIFAMGTQTGESVGVIIISYLFAMVPNMLIFFVLWLLRKQFRITIKANVISFILAGVVVLFVFFMK